MFVYDAAGRKLATKTYQNGTLTGTSRYIAGLVFQDNAINYISTAEGRVTKISNNNWNYEYFMKDHLGSVRMSFDKDPTSGNARIIQENAYYSFGGEMPGLSWIFGTENLLKYNGKEEQKQWNVSDYGWRSLDKNDPSWGTPDQLADVLPSITPYRYGLNNPIKYTDIKGLIEWPLAGTSAMNKKDIISSTDLNDKVVRTSLYQEERNVGTSPHIGIDYRASIGTDFYSLGDGTVSDMGQTTSGIKYITVEYGNGDKIRFLHISGTAEGLKVGSAVTEGQILGQTGNTGKYYDKKKKEYVNYPAHLHLDGVDKNGNSIDPEGRNYGEMTNAEFFGAPEKSDGASKNIKDKKTGKVVGKSYSGNAEYFKNLLNNIINGLDNLEGNSHGPDGH